MKHIVLSLLFCFTLIVESKSEVEQRKPLKKSIAESARKHWAFQPISKPGIPGVRQKEWVRNPIDAFVLAQLEKKGRKPAQVADRTTLLRRAYFDLLGLPPDPEMITKFIRVPKAWPELIDSLLAS